MKIIPVYSFYNFYASFLWSLFGHIDASSYKEASTLKFVLLRGSVIMKLRLLIQKFHFWVPNLASKSYKNLWK